jgi:hypothetical protein
MVDLLNLTEPIKMWSLYINQNSAKANLNFRLQVCLKVVSDSSTGGSIKKPSSNFSLISTRASGTFLYCFQSFIRASRELLVIWSEIHVQGVSDKLLNVMCS